MTLDPSLSTLYAAPEDDRSYRSLFLISKSHLGAQDSLVLTRGDIEGNSVRFARDV